VYVIAYLQPQACARPAIRCSVKNVAVLENAALHDAKQVKQAKLPHPGVCVSKTVPHGPGLEMKLKMHVHALLGPV
jgi:hypothetical protein